MTESTDESIITARTYSGCYGGEQSNIGDLLIVKVQCPSLPLSLSMKQIIFVVDESGSMKPTMPAVRASLFAARNGLLNLIGKNVADEAERDRIFTEESNVCIITFSSDARCIWESNVATRLRNVSPSVLTFSEAVTTIHDDSSTNLGEALELAIQKKLPNHATWIIVLTDGLPNRGTRQTPESFKNFMKEMPSQTKVIPLGYTTEFDPEILSILGTMNYVENEESIAEILGGIMGEIATCYGMHATIELPSFSQEVNLDELIVAPKESEVPHTVIGSNLMGCVYNDRKFTYGYLPWGNTQRPDFSRYQGLHGSVSYHDIVRNVRVQLPFTIGAGGQIPDEVKGAYFESAKARIILGIYNRKRARTLTREQIDSIRAKLQDWKHPLAIAHKEEILRLLQLPPSDRHEMMGMLGNATMGQTQTSYHMRGPHSTVTQRLTARGATNDFRTSQQPPLNPSETIVIDPGLLERI